MLYGLWSRFWSRKRICTEHFVIRIIRVVLRSADCVSLMKNTELLDAGFALGLSRFSAQFKSDSNTEVHFLLTLVSFGLCHLLCHQEANVTSINITRRVKNEKRKIQKLYWCQSKEKMLQKACRFIRVKCCDVQSVLFVRDLAMRSRSELQEQKVCHWFLPQSRTKI